MFAHQRRGVEIILAPDPRHRPPRPGPRRIPEHLLEFGLFERPIPLEQAKPEQWAIAVSRERPQLRLQGISRVISDETGCMPSLCDCRPQPLEGGLNLVDRVPAISPAGCS